MISVYILLYVSALIAVMFYIFSDIKFDVHLDMNKISNRGIVHHNFNKFVEDFNSHKHLLFASKKFENSLFYKWFKFPEHTDEISDERLEILKQSIINYDVWCVEESKFYIHASRIIVNGNRYVAKSSKDFKKACKMISQHYQEQVQKNLFDGMYENC